ncbi:hypothetical protein PO878_10145 [Iamia majanohamensis]|uniref:DUF2085 domain-containing protein n=1 Tax=Iamia majanohamensis TaxID=467976 RepID=A0AAE9YJ68_9ACTN|nr:hypothetical protein [Iamia majanohamensis]WCO69086.1 hypothetical protein PO878_10145 [Iamia majanohamensis]
MTRPPVEPDDRADADLAPYVPLASEAPVADTPMWLSHHWPDQYERCAVVAGRHVCRRCLWMYPVALVAAVVAAVGPWWPRDLDAVLIPLLPLPAVVDFVADNLHLVRYSARRQAALSALGAVAAGAGYLRYLEDPADPVVWATVLAYGAACLAAVVVGHLRARR